MTVGACHGERPSSPSPRAWLFTLGAAGMPIGCALIFFAIRHSWGELTGPREVAQPDARLGELRSAPE
jgi:hypothetical protein